MEEERQREEAAVTEWRRSRNGVTAASAVGSEPPNPGHARPESPHPEVGSPIEEDLPVVMEALEPVRMRAQRTSRLPRLVKKEEKVHNPPFTAEQRLLILDSWLRSGLPAKDFAPLIGISHHTLYIWKKRFSKYGPEGLTDQKKGGPKGSKLSEATKRAILMIKEAHPEYGCHRISDMLFRGPALPASPQAVARLLKEEGYELEEYHPRHHTDKKRSFERAKTNQLWQTDLFTFMLKRQNRRVYLIAFMDDHSRFIVGYGLHASQSSAIVLEVLRASIASYGTPEEILTDNGSQYVTWRGKSAFTKELEKRGVKQVIARPRHPQTLGKIERFWGTLWRECIETSVFIDLGDARKRIGLFIDYYNFQRTHQGIDGLVPADRFFCAAPEVLKTLKERVAANALELARNGVPKPPLYLTGNLGGKGFSLHMEGDRAFLTSEEGEKKEVELVPPDKSPEENIRELPAPVCPEGVTALAVPDIENEKEPLPGVSALDEGLKRINESVDFQEDVDENGEGGHNDYGSR